MTITLWGPPFRPINYNVLTDICPHKVTTNIQGRVQTYINSLKTYPNLYHNRCTSNHNLNLYL